MKLLTLAVLFCCCFTFSGSLKQRIPVLNSNDPGPCKNETHGKEVLVKTRDDEEKVIICVKDKGIYRWKCTDGTQNTDGEFFNPGYDCSDILNKLESAKDGFYWITLTRSNPRKVWCDMRTNGGGYMLIGRKNNSITWSVPSNDITVEPYGKPHWSSSLGDAPIIDFRVQMATREDFKATKAHWSIRLQVARPLKQLLMTTNGCDQRSAGVGNIAYVKDLQTERIVTTKLRCSKFGLAHHFSSPFGWPKMNSCMAKSCPWGFAYLAMGKYKQQLDHYGSFSYSATGSISGMEHNATAFVGCDNSVCCACYGPVGGTKDYCAENCTAINSGTVTKNVFTWFWVRSSLPKRLWKKCMDYQVKRDDGKFIWYKLVGHSVVPVQGRCSENLALLHDGIVVVPDNSTAQKVPAVEGLLTYRKDKQELYVISNNTWNEVAQKNKITKQINANQKLNLDKIKKLEENTNSETKNIMKETDKKTKFNFGEIKKLEKELGKEKNLIIKQISASRKFNLDENAKIMKKLTNLESVVISLQECNNYKLLDNKDRNVKYSVGGRLKCDSGISSGWYRFSGDAGAKMSTTCFPKGWRCSTHAVGWMKGAHPSFSEGKVTRTVCFGYAGKCCDYQTNIEVINCGLFFIYKLGYTPNCSLRYCGADV